MVTLGLWDVPATVTARAGLWDVPVTARAGLWDVPATARRALGRAGNGAPGSGTCRQRRAPG